MCQQLMDFCNNSTRPLLYAGALLTLLLSVGLGYTSCTNQALYSGLDPLAGQELSLAYHLQLVASLGLLLASLLACQAAHYDQKHALGALAALSALVCVAAVAGALLLPPGAQLAARFGPRLESARELYNFSEPIPANGPSSAAAAAATTAQSAAEQTPAPMSDKAARAANSTAARQRRFAPDGAANLTAHEATCVWDKLQALGCCGLDNATSTWPANKLPKSCCANFAASPEGELRCERADEAHSCGCLALIGRTGTSVHLALALAALLSLYLCIVSSVSSYRKFHYSEASQSPYT